MYNSPEIYVIERMIFSDQNLKDFWRGLLRPAKNVYLTRINKVSLQASVSDERSIYESASVVKSKTEP